MVIDDENLTTNYLRWYAKEIGATLYQNTDDRVTFSLKSDDELWWATALWNNPEEKKCTIKVVKQNIVPFDKTITIKPSETRNGWYYFTTIAGESDFVTALVEIAGGEYAQAEIRGEQYIRTGFLRRDFSYQKTLEIKNCRRYALNDIPQTNQPVFWSIKLPSDNKYQPESVTIRFEEQELLSPLPSATVWEACEWLELPGVLRFQNNRLSISLNMRMASPITASQTVMEIRSFIFQQATIIYGSICLAAVEAVSAWCRSMVVS